MDASSDRPVLEADRDFNDFFRNLAVDHNTVRLFDRNGFFSIHGEDAIKAANDLYRTQAVIKELSTLPCLTMTKTVMERFLQDTLRRGKHIEVWQGNARSGWQISKEGSPGNTSDLEEYMGSMLEVENISILAITINKTTSGFLCGVSFADLNRRLIGVTEFAEGDTFSHLECLIIQVGAKECLINEDLQHEDHFGKVRAVLERCNVVCTAIRPSHFVATNILEDIRRLINPMADIADWKDGKRALESASAMTRYLRLLSDASNLSHYNVWQLDIKAHMKLDGSALKALSLIPTAFEGTSKTMNLFGLLNQCRTSLGSRMLSQWLKQPLLNMVEIEARHSILQAFFDESEMRSNLQAELKLIPDLARLSNKFHKGQAGLEDVIRAYQVSTRIPGIVDAFDLGSLEEMGKVHLSVRYVAPLTEHQALLGKFQDLVETTVDLAALDRHEYLIRPDFDQTLEILHEKITHARSGIDAEFHLVADDLNIEVEKKLKLENHSNFGFCLRLSRNEASIIRNKSGIRELQTAKAGVYFTTSKLLAISREYTEYQSQYSRYQAGLVREVVTIAASYCPVLEALGNIIAHLDVMLAFAQVSLHAPTAYVRPTMNNIGTGNIIMKECRHPCIEAQDDVNFIPNDVQLIRNEAEFLIITGANMGGKSTYIRQIGIIVLMAQIGCFVPCASAEITIVDSILARVGAGDSQMKGVSTFMSECLETSAILKSASRNSLVIIDELGRGTSTTDGFGLAYAISEHIIKEIGCFALFATHFHELTSLSERQPGVKNLHVATHVEQENENSVTLLYKVVEGSCNQSFGINVAELARFPKSVVDMAKRKLQELEDAEIAVEQPASNNVEIKRSKFDYNLIQRVLSKLEGDVDIKTFRKVVSQELSS